jgi:hypothetical protein
MGQGQITAADGGTWKLGDLVVNRVGFGAMRLPQTGRALVADADKQLLDRRSNGSWPKKRTAANHFLLGRSTLDIP